jgi:hypothetical protein
MTLLDAATQKEKKSSTIRLCLHYVLYVTPSLDSLAYSWIYLSPKTPSGCPHTSTFSYILDDEVVSAWGLCVTRL